VNCRGAAGGSVRTASGAAWFRAGRDGPARRDLRPVGVRRHAPQGAEVRSARNDRQSVQGGEGIASGAAVYWSCRTCPGKDKRHPDAWEGNRQNCGLSADLPPASPRPLQRSGVGDNSDALTARPGSRGRSPPFPRAGRARARWVRQRGLGLRPRALLKSARSHLPLQGDESPTPAARGHRPRGRRVRVGLEARASARAAERRRPEGVLAQQRLDSRAVGYLSGQEDPSSWLSSRLRLDTSQFTADGSSSGPLGVRGAVRHPRLQRSPS
jgi:hypothetical protein